MIFSADDFFMKDGKYVFEPAKIGEAHMTCFKGFMKQLAVVDGSGKLVAKEVFIMRGIPGSGKSTYAKALNVQEGWKKGSYRVDIDEDHSRLNHERLIVDNTNTRAVEIAPYWQLAAAYGLPVTIILVSCYPHIASVRNRHGVPPEVVFGQYQAIMTEKLPPWWKQTVVFGGVKG